MLLIWALLILTDSLTGQTDPVPPEFPASFIGHWTGQLTGASPGKKSWTVGMELRVYPDSTGKGYPWQILYHGEKMDLRDYILKPRAADSGHWEIDERNGIILEAYWAAGSLVTVFTVMDNRIQMSYRPSGDQMMIDLVTTPAAPGSQTGNNTNDSPLVDLYKVKGIQRAVLTRKK